MIHVPKRNKPSTANPDRDFVTPDWKVRVKAELDRRGWTPERLAEEIGWSRAGVYRLLNTRQQSSRCVSLIENELQIPRNQPPKEDPQRKRMDELLPKLSSERKALIMKLMEEFASEVGDG